MTPGGEGPPKKGDVKRDELHRSREAVSGVAYAAGAYLIWGFFPVYFHALGGVPALEVLSHRIVWSCAFLLLVITALRRWVGVYERLSKPGTIAWLALSAIAISSNWLIYIWAVNAGRVLEASLGYFVNPLVTVLLGVVFLRESLTRRQWLAVGLAGVGVLFLVLRSDEVPWVALALAFTFGLYGLIRKRVVVDALGGLFAEVGLLFPLAILYLGFLAATGRGHFGEATPRTLLLSASGVITAVPLLMFAKGVERLALSTVGLLQYINPTEQFAIAVLAFKEPFTASHAVAFALIWASLLLYSLELVRIGRER